MDVRSYVWGERMCLILVYEFFLFDFDCTLCLGLAKGVISGFLVRGPFFPLLIIDV